MPTVNVPRDELFRRLGRSYTTQEFEDLCFQFGIELDEIIAAGSDGGEDCILKIEVPANRYDLLCTEGIARALCAFTNPEHHVPLYRLEPAVPRYTMTVKEPVVHVRPFVVCAILRDVKLTKTSLKSFIDLQDKLHHTICRRRSLVAIGTHDLDKISPPFFYDARPPDSFSFVPLGCGKEMTGQDVVCHFSNHLQLKAYLQLIKGSPIFPLILDAEDRILSLPPLINANFCRVTEETKNIFIECTAVDVTKAQVVLNTVVSMFSEYCASPYTVEPVRVTYIHPEYAPLHRNVVERGFSTQQTMSNWSFPNVESRLVPFSLDYVKKVTGVSMLSEDDCIHLLSKMMIKAEKINTGTSQSLLASVPITRSDVLHECDIVEDVAVAYGFNNLPISPCHTLAINALNVLSERVRSLLVLCGHIECLTYTLSSVNENYAFLGRSIFPVNAFNLEDTSSYQSGASPVRLAVAKTREFEQMRSTLIPGMLKTIAANKGHRELPLRLFEVGDVCVLDSSTSVAARNLRYCCVAFADEHCSGLEEIHGVLDALLRELHFIGDYAIAEMEAEVATYSTSAHCENVENEENVLRNAPAQNLQKVLSRAVGTFKLVPSYGRTFLPGRQVHIVATTKNGFTERIPTFLGVMGTLHPDVLKNFGITMPVSLMELNLEAFKSWLSSVDLYG